MADTDIVWPVGTTDQDPDLADRPLVFDHGHACDGRAALRVHVADDEEADRAIRGRSDSAALHIRHYGHHRQNDFQLQRPTA